MARLDRPADRALVAVIMARRVWVLVSAVACIAIAAVVVLRSGLHPRAVAEWLAMIGDRWWAPLAFIALYTLFDTLLLPATIMTLTAGVVWGWWRGGLWVVAASLIGSFVPYLIARSGAPWIDDLMQRRASRVRDALRREGFMTLLLLRLIPVFPYVLINYAAGLAGVGVRDYIVATFVGTLPGIFIFTFLASSIASGVLHLHDAFIRVLVAGALLAVLAIVSRAFAGRVRKRIE